MTEPLRTEPITDEQREARSPMWIAPICTWLASAEAKNVTGRVFQVAGDEIAIAESFHKGPKAENVDDPTQMRDVVADLMARANLNSDMRGEYAEGPGRPGKTI